jgi:hypothetical protein
MLPFYYSNWGEAPKFIICVFVPWWQIFFVSARSPYSACQEGGVVRDVY